MVTLRRLATLLLAVHAVGSVDTTPPRLGGERLPTSCTSVAFDIGSNNGEDTVALLGRNLCVLAVDANPAMVAKVGEPGNDVCAAAAAAAATIYPHQHSPPAAPPARPDQGEAGQAGWPPKRNGRGGERRAGGAIEGGAGWADVLCDGVRGALVLRQEQGVTVRQDRRGDPGAAGRLRRVVVLPSRGRATAVLRQDRHRGAPLRLRRGAGAARAQPTAKVRRS